MLPARRQRATSKAIGASWENLCPDMKQHIFAALSLVDLGRAAPASREFCAAYRARLAVAHPAVIEAGVSCYGEAFLRSLSTLVLRLCRGLDVFSGFRSAKHTPLFRIAGDGTRHEFGGSGGTRLRPNCGVVGHRGSGSELLYLAVGSPQLDTLRAEIEPTAGSPPARTASAHPKFSLALMRTAGRADMHVRVRCDAADCREVAGAFAAIFEYLQPCLGWSSRLRGRGARGFKVNFVLDGRRPPRNPSDVANDIAAAVLAIPHIIPRLDIDIALPEQASRTRCILPALETVSWGT